MFQAELHIPKERVAVLIGKKGATRKSIEKLTKTRIVVAKEGDVAIEGEDNLNVFLTTAIIKAIGRGFNPEIAKTLWSEDKYFEIVPIKQKAHDSEKKLLRIRSRIIGSEGLARKNIEMMTNTSISVYGKTIAIIGSHEDVLLAKQAVEKLIYGSKHGNVYKYIEKQRKRVY